MRLFRITLSHGDEHITFDGAGARSGSMFHVRRDAIEGLWSSPASKVSLTERETANGASPISDGDTLYAARTVSIPFAIQSNYNHADLIRARILLGRLLGWHDVRMDIYDDGDETVLYGYVEAKYSDIPYDHADTGTITLVCPDPRRVSKHESTVTMNTSSNSLGGLSFGVPEYVKSWTGTNDASSSTLSDDDGLIATNYATDSRATSNHVFYGLGPRTSVKDTDGKWVYSVPASTAGANCFFITPITRDWTPPVSEDYVLVAAFGDIVGTTLADIIFEDNTGHNSPTLAMGDDWRAVKCSPSTAGTVRLSIGVWAKSASPAAKSFKLLNWGVYSLSDWQAMQARGVDWFSGDSQSPQPNTGLVFPLDFGQSGNTGNTGMISNNGSYTTMPVLTVHGNLDSGLTIHWTTSDGNEGDLSFNGAVQNVPVTINTDTHSAIMGGLDVSYLLGSRDWPRIPAGGSCSFSLLASGSGWVTVQSHDTYM